MTEWLEIEFDLQLKFFPFIFMQLIQSAANIICTYAFVTVPYAFVATAIFDDLRNSSITTHTRHSSKIVTKYFGLLDEFEICKMYRILRLLNHYVNACIQRVLVSAHQVGLVACFSIMLYFFVEFQPVIHQQETVGCAVVIGCITTPLITVWVQSNTLKTHISRFKCSVRWVIITKECEKI